MKTPKLIAMQHPFWTGLNPKHLEPLLDTARAVVFSADEILFREGEVAADFYLVEAGRAVLETFVPGSGITPIQTVGPGDVIGWSWLFPPYRWHLSARAVEPMQAIVLDAPLLRTLSETNHDLGYALVLRVAHILSQRLQATRMQLLDLHGVAC
jgi:CRP-like cAMP-binding protein